MPYILFDSFETRSKKNLPYKKFAFTFRRIIQAASMATASLTLFQGATSKGSDFESKFDLINNPLTFFDALPGDCACQVRPAMLHDIINYLNENEEASRFISTSVGELQKIRQRAIYLHECLCTHDMNPKVLVKGAKNNLSLQEFYRITGIIDWFDYLDHHCHLCDVPECERANTNTNPTSNILAHVEGNFRTSNLQFVLQFIVFSYSIGRYKVALKQNNNIIYRIDPNVSICASNVQVIYEEYKCLDLPAVQCKHRKGPSKCSWSAREENVKTIENELTIVQRYVPH